MIVEAGGIENQRRDFGSQEMIRAGGAQRCKATEIARADELHSFRIIADVHHLRAAGADETAQAGHQGNHRGAACIRFARFHRTAAVRSLRFHGFIEMARRIADEPYGPLITCTRIVAPADETVPSEDDAFEIRARPNKIAQLQAKRKAGPFPGQPADAAAPDFACGRLTVRRCRKRDDGIGVHMVDVREREIGVKRRINRCRPRIERERAVREITDHLVFVLYAAIKRLEPEQPIEIERREAIALHRADVAARSLHPKHRDIGAGKRIDTGKFSGRVAATEIGDREIGAEKI